ncbi:CDP-glucose 4,6-dehydratase [Sphingobium sp. SCG-1]|uniref:CDP-glucose 4,6-dehydratase n=1 Tax=Sphingobium sp. SCG-1 TaxID=2072936 RepID=UPI000CD67877|nr:CDP-glucose 4,6-dehydratase [Sphingobium sp. SCG-1]AUW57392.1 CDP-glucose 4,6-dehydratase [Sphingobium sp. SCG-1]
MPEAHFPADDLRRAFSGKQVLLTGHTGFKGAWLALWLTKLGARVRAVALPPTADQPCMFSAARIEALVEHRIADIRCEEQFAVAIDGFDPDLVVHMAAQALVRPSYAAPIDTFRTNVIGTAVVMDAARRMERLRGIVVVTSDKCYENREWQWGYRETDRLGGKDPYSASKACTELVATSYRKSFFGEPDSAIVATVRAGNVIGGGDWSTDRLVPDMIRASAAGESVRIRNPASVRPWQHVIEPLAGYLQLAAGMLDGRRSLSGAWNFGPNAESVVDVGTLAQMLQQRWGPDAAPLHFDSPTSEKPEAGLLRIDSSKAISELGWRPRLSLRETLTFTADWYRACLSGSANLRVLSEQQIDQYMNVPHRQHRTPAAVALQEGEAACA